MPAHGRKRRHPIEKSAVPEVFNAARIDELLEIGRPREPFDKNVFATGVCAAAVLYAQEARVPDVNDLYREYERLHKALIGTQRPTAWAKAAALFRDLSPTALDRLARMRRTLTLPTADDFDDPTRCERARDIVFSLLNPQARLCVRTTRKVRYELCGLFPTKSFPKREAELKFVMRLRLTWVEASRDQPAAYQRASRGGNADRKGPFVQMVQRCLELVGSSYADAVGLLNELNRRSNQTDKRAPANIYGKPNWSRTGGR
jgi:hypothetical protein